MSLEKSNSFVDNEISFEIENVSYNEIKLHLKCKDEEDTLSFIHSNSGSFCIMSNTDQSSYSFSKYMKGKIILGMSTILNRNSGALKGYDFILCEDGACVFHNVVSGINNVYIGYDPNKGSLYKIRDLVFAFKSSYDEHSNFKSMKLNLVR